MTQTQSPTRHSVATSRDGTEIGYWTSGEGPPLVLVHGGTADHTRWRTVLGLLEPHRTVHAVDRRGRGASGDAPEYAVEREFEDVAAVVDAVAEGSGGPVDLLGHSFGAICTLGGASLTSNLRKLVLYEPPIVAGEDAFPPGLLARLERLLAEDRREDLLVAFFREAVMMPDEELEMFRTLPAWQGRLAAAHTLPREQRVVESGKGFDPARAATVTCPALLVLGGDSPEVFKTEAETVAAALPDVRVVVLPGQQHIAMDTAPELFAGAVLDFLLDRS